MALSSSEEIEEDVVEAPKLNKDLYDQLLEEADKVNSEQSIHELDDCPLIDSADLELS